MPKSTVQEEDPYKLPEDTHFPARLNKVEQKSREFVYKKGPQAGEKGERVWWEWEFQITEGEYAPLKGYGETEPKTTVTPDGSRNKAAMWIEALRDMEVSFGEDIDTDDYNGLPCAITVRHESRERSDGQGMFYSTPVKDVYPERILKELQSGASAQQAQPDF
jgi:hypothetical protein